MRAGAGLPVLEAARPQPWARTAPQYVYRCPNANSKCRNQILEPLYRPTAKIIDGSLIRARINDGERPLAAKTMARIIAGVERYWQPMLVPVEGRVGKVAWPVNIPARTMITRTETGLLGPTAGTWRTEARAVVSASTEHLGGVN